MAQGVARRRPGNPDGSDGVFDRSLRDGFIEVVMNSSEAASMIFYRAVWFVALVLNGLTVAIRVPQTVSVVRSAAEAHHMTAGWVLVGGVIAFAITTLAPLAAVVALAWQWRLSR
jgi:hypothetical protein